MAKKLVIYTPGEASGLIAALEKGTPKLVAITFSSITPEDIAEVELRNEKKYKAKIGKEENPSFDKVEFEQRLFKKSKARCHKALVEGVELIIISETGLLSDDLKEIKGDIESTYADKYESLSILECDSSDIAVEVKKAFFISGILFESLATLLTKGGADYSKIISNSDISIMDQEFKFETANPIRKLLVVNVSEFSNKDEEFYKRMSNTEKYIVQSIKLPVAEKKIGQQGNNGSIATDEGSLSSISYVKASELKTQLKKMKWLTTNWETFIADLKKEALEAGFLLPDMEIEDDLTPKD